MGRGGDELSASEVSNEMMDLFLNFFVCLFVSVTFPQKQPEKVVVDCDGPF